MEVDFWSGTLGFSQLMQLNHPQRKSLCFDAHFGRFSLSPTDHGIILSLYMLGAYV